jgi:hypothetical protein
VRRLAQLALLAASACTRYRPAAAAPVGSAPVAEGSPPAAAVVPDPEARAACDAAASPWRGRQGPTVRVSDTLLGARDVIADPATDTLTPPGPAGDRWAACVVEGLAPAGLDSAGRAGLYWPAAGWGALARLNADGPDGQVQVYQRGWVRCQVAWEWDGGDDSDPAYVPDPFFRERTLCWRHGRLLAPADTMPLEP